MQNLRLTVYPLEGESIFQGENGIYSTEFHTSIMPQIEGHGARVIPLTKDRLGYSFDQGADIFSLNYHDPRKSTAKPIMGVYGRNRGLSSQRLEFVICSSIPQTNFEEGHVFGFDELCKLIKQGHNIFGFAGNPEEHYSK